MGVGAVSVLRRFRKPPRLLAQLLVQRIANRLNIEELDVPLLLDDLTDSCEVARQRSPLANTDGGADRPVRIGWVLVPASAGSGGHTTLFRMVRAAADAGFENTLLLYRRYSEDLDHYAMTLRSAWPWLDAAIAPVGDVIDGFDACVASSWATAHVIAKRAVPGTRSIYFIQDYEPYFYPRGDSYAFAEDTYRFGFRNIALGPMIQRTLERELGVTSDLVPFGGDASSYRLTNKSGIRSGVVFYAKPGNHRRGYQLAIRALKEFHAKHPEQAIHVYGDEVHDLPFPFVSHGRLTPQELARLYNQTIAGLVLSFTNVSLVPEELLACGNIPVVNDSEFAREVIENRFIQWALPTPSSLAEALSAAVTAAERERTAIEAARSVSARSWSATETAVVDILADELDIRSAANYGDCSSR